MFLCLVSWTPLFNAIYLVEMFSGLYSQPPSLFYLPWCFLTLCSMGLSWMLDLRTQLCIYTSGQQTSKMAQVWSPSTVNVMLRVGISNFLHQKPMFCISDTLVPIPDSIYRQLNSFSTFQQQPRVQNINVNVSNYCCRRGSQSLYRCFGTF